MKNKKRNKTAMAKIEIIINGQSGEYCIGSLTKEQYEFWNKTEDFYIHEYVEEGYDYAEIDSIPSNADFLDGSDWYDFNDLDHLILLGGYIIEIDIIVDDKKMFSGEFKKFCDEFSPKINNINIDNNIIDAEYYCEIIDIQRGKIFHGIIETENFDMKNIEFEILDEEIKTIFYNGEEINNDFGETRSKGISVELFKK